MPHLQFETDAPLDAAEREAFAAWVTGLYAEVMDTGTEHVAVTIRHYDGARLFLGRAAGSTEPVAFLNADIRRGRTPAQRIRLAKTLMDAMHTRWGVPRAHLYVIYTEHPGEDFVRYEGPLKPWAEGEDDPAGG